MTACRRIWSCEREVAELDLVFVETVDQIVASANGDGHHGQRRVLASRGNETGAIHHEDIFHVVSLIEGVQHGFFGIVAHASGSQFMNGHAGHFDAGLRFDVLRAGGFEAAWAAASSINAASFSP